MMKRGDQLQNPLDTMVQAEVREWIQYITRKTENGVKQMFKKSRKTPAIVDDKMCAEDWSTM